jgi:hypothetical protein
MLFPLTVLGAVTVGMIKGRVETEWQMIAGALLGFSIGLANLVEIYLCKRTLLAMSVNASLGGGAGALTALLLDAQATQVIWYLAVGFILGLTSRLWIQHVNF